MENITDVSLHTKGEWKVYAKDWIYAGDKSIATIQHTGDSKETKANAAHIVKCVNCYDELTQALAKCISFMNLIRARGDALTAAKEALTKATL